MIKIYLDSEPSSVMHIDSTYYINGNCLKEKNASEMYHCVVDAIRNKESFIEISSKKNRVFLVKDKILYIEQNGDIPKEELEKVFWSFL